jgi:hypothetical protein
MEGSDCPASTDDARWSKSRDPADRASYIGKITGLEPDWEPEQAEDDVYAQV